MTGTGRGPRHAPVGAACEKQEVEAVTIIERA